MTLDELSKLCDEATPGNWWADDRYVKSGEDRIVTCDGYFDGVDNQKQDAAFIAEARTYMPLLIAVALATDVYLNGGTTKTLVQELSRTDNPHSPHLRKALAMHEDYYLDLIGKALDTLKETE